METFKLRISESAFLSLHHHLQTEENSLPIIDRYLLSRILVGAQLFEQDQTWPLGIDQTFIDWVNNLVEIDFSTLDRETRKKLWLLRCRAGDSQEDYQKLKFPEDQSVYESTRASSKASKLEKLTRQIGNEVTRLHRTTATEVYIQNEMMGGEDALPIILKNPATYVEIEAIKRDVNAAINAYLKDYLGLCEILPRHHPIEEIPLQALTLYYKFFKLELYDIRLKLMPHLRTNQRDMALAVGAAILDTDTTSIQKVNDFIIGENVYPFKGSIKDTLKSSNRAALLPLSSLSKSPSEQRPRIQECRSNFKRPKEYK